MDNLESACLFGEVLGSDFGMMDLEPVEGPEDRMHDDKEWQEP